jgi:V-type H+-transporting ATPase subunit C
MKGELTKPQTTSKAARKIKTNLDKSFSYLAGNAFGRDKKGRVTKDDSSVGEFAAAAQGGGGEEYTAYVYYEFEMP